MSVKNTDKMLDEMPPRSVLLTAVCFVPLLNIWITFLPNISMSASENSFIMHLWRQVPHKDASLSFLPMQPKESFSLKVLGKSVGLCKTTKRKDQLYISLLVSVWRIICENFNSNRVILAEI